jgi:hypothetical protein
VIGVVIYLNVQIIYLNVQIICLNVEVILLADECLKVVFDCVIGFVWIWAVGIRLLALSYQPWQLILKTYDLRLCFHPRCAIKNNRLLLLAGVWLLNIEYFPLQSSSFFSLPSPSLPLFKLLDTIFAYQTISQILKSSCKNHSK